MALNPSAIYFLTDGSFSLPKNFVKDNLQGKGIPVHSIAFENNNGKKVLKDISSATGGTYKFVQ
jgi:hypothetical protein